MRPRRPSHPAGQPSPQAAGSDPVSFRPGEERRPVKSAFQCAEGTRSCQSNRDRPAPRAHPRLGTFTEGGSPAGPHTPPSTDARADGAGCPNPRAAAGTAPQPEAEVWTCVSLLPASEPLDSGSRCPCSAWPRGWSSRRFQAHLPARPGKMLGGRRAPGSAGGQAQRSRIPSAAD